MSEAPGTWTDGAGLEALARAELAAAAAAIRQACPTCEGRPPGALPCEACVTAVLTMIRDRHRKRGPSA